MMFCPTDTDSRIWRLYRAERTTGKDVNRWRKRSRRQTVLIDGCTLRSAAFVSRLAKIGIEVTPRTLVDVILRTSRSGDLYGLRRHGISFAKLQDEYPNGITLREELPTGVIGRMLHTFDRRVNLAPEPILGELKRLTAEGPSGSLAADRDAREPFAQLVDAQQQTAGD